MDWKNYIVKMTLYPRHSRDSNAILIKMPKAFFTQLRINNSKLCMGNTSEIAKTILGKAVEASHSWFQTIPWDYGNQDRQHVLAQKQMHRSNGTEEPRNRLTLIWATNLWQWRQEVCAMGKSLYSEWCWENWTTTCKKIKLDYSLTPCSRRK